ncbi:hypothetical protein PTSG_11562 [Salpingoeca rosetta]|uniref:C2H2-type domain-containing protein n=1 Tax=Salpingoeca rosetta (strain ATCC 50818 / BSB-021) TaxID=946362 RepID=F2TVW1_SALR5|nr:uncharacterized protein PTSG_11562 [Salpingoeca rosetta]EGD72207.1 hypothetical protein PTSG_11562 [Salpingoeca rosetta]|eukprot:XP_004998778.1 hypothetical protein PTSG_11562 [Salpingoeca rosetta]
MSSRPVVEESTPYIGPAASNSTPCSISRHRSSPDFGSAKAHTVPDTQHNTSTSTSASRTSLPPRQRAPATRTPKPGGLTMTLPSTAAKALPRAVPTPAAPSTRSTTTPPTAATTTALSTTTKPSVATSCNEPAKEEAVDQHQAIPAATMAILSDTGLSTKERLEALNHRMNVLRQQYRAAMNAKRATSHSEAGSSAISTHPAKKAKRERPRLAPRDINTMHEQTLARISLRIQAHMPETSPLFFNPGPLTRARRRTGGAPPRPAKRTTRTSRGRKPKAATRNMESTQPTPAIMTTTKQSTPLSKTQSLDPHEDSTATAITTAAHAGTAAAAAAAATGTHRVPVFADPPRKRTNSTESNATDTRPPRTAKIASLDTKTHSSSSSSRVAGLPLKKKKSSKSAKAKPKRAASGGKEKAVKAPASPSSSSSGEEEQEQSLFHCPWPNCHKTFRRIKSRSAHLKWHGGDYKSSTTAKRRPIADATTTLTVTSTPGQASAGQGPVVEQEMHPGDVFVFNERCKEKQLRGHACSFVKHAHDEGARVAVMHVHHTVPLQIVHVKDLSILTRRGHDDAASDTGSDLDSPQPSPMTFTKGQTVLQRRTQGDGCVFYERGIIKSTSKTDGEFEVRSLHSKEESSVAAEALLPDTTVSHSELTLGLRVVSVVDDNEHLLWPGTVHRIEPTRARVNFDSKPLRWRKASALRLAARHSFR